MKLTIRDGMQPYAQALRDAGQEEKTPLPAPLRLSASEVERSASFVVHGASSCRACLKDRRENGQMLTSDTYEAELRDELWESIPRRLRKELVRKSRDVIAGGNLGMVESPSLRKDAEQLAKTLATDVLYWNKYGWLPD